MRLINNFDQLATSPERKIVLELIEAGLVSIQPENVIHKNISLQNNILTLQNETYDLSQFQNVYLIGFGKGSSGISKMVEGILGDKLSEGYVIDAKEEKFSKIQFTLGTHPLPSPQNFEFTQHLIDRFDGKLSEKDLVLVVICGGGSAMLVAPDKVTLDQKIQVNKALLTSGANIIEMNMVRKHLSKVKGGGLAKVLHPATVVSLIFSDVPGNDLSFIASGPTVKDTTTIDDAWNMVIKYKINEKLNLTRDMFSETPKDDALFSKSSNILILSNLTALSAMQEKAKELGYQATIHSDKLQGEARTVGPHLIEITKPNGILLAGGETTVTAVEDHGEGGRNQELVLASLQYLDEQTVIAAVDSDGWDNTPFAGAIGDISTLKKAQDLNIDPQMYLNKNDSKSFFDKVKDGIITDRLASNVADLIIVLKK